MKTKFLALSLFLACASHAATTINVSNNVTVSGIRRFGISGISHYYYDRLLLKNLVWHNAGFEGLVFRSIIRCASGSATGCLDDNPYTQWPSGFWDGGEFEFILGAAKGRTGTIATFATAPRDQVTGSTWTFSSGGVTPAAGDYFIARKYTPGGADMGWNTQVNGGATITTEFNDLPPGTTGRQCIRLSASAQGQLALINSSFGAFAGSNFVVMNGDYRLTFKAKAAGGANNINVTVGRGSNTFTTTNIALTSSWATYTHDFHAGESGSVPVDMVGVNFRASNSSVLLDDVSLVETNVDVTNTTAFRDPVITALRSYNPGALRSHNLDLGSSLEDLTGDPFAHRRHEYSVYATNKATIPYGWYEFLQLCEFLHVDPYLDIPVTFSDAEAANLMEYLGGPISTPYGARRAARGHPAPWTDSFDRIHLEFGNEAWNPTFRGGTFFAADYGARGNDFFGVIRNSPYYSSKFNLILGVQAANPINSRTTHNASANHDMLAIGPYIGTRIDDYATNEQLFGGLFAESTWWSSPTGTPFPGPVRTTYDYINATSRPVPLIVYEVNMHTTQGSIPQDVLDSFTPSLGAGLAVVDHMLIMLRDERIRDQFLFSLGGYRFTREDGKTALIWSITRDMGVSDRKRPQFLAAKLANEALGGDMMQTTQSGDNPMWNQPLTNRIALDNIPYIQSFAFADNTRHSVIVFNLHRSNSLQVNFAGTNAPSGAVTIRQLTSANITDTNESAENVAITTQSLSNFDPAQNITLPPYSMTLITTSGTGGLPLAIAKGDVNGNGSVTAFDASVVLQSVVGATALDTRQRCAADYDGNGSVSAFDAASILRCIVGVGCTSSTCN
jgi:alpha-L-arabinofuranosidase